MILKTNRRNPIILALLLLAPASSWGFSSYECLRELMPITDRASLQNKRQEVEEPFIVSDKYIVFPEVSNGTVSGFYFYGPKGAAFYDAVDRGGKTVQIGDLKFKSAEGVYDLVAQPGGLETVTVSFLPGFKFAPTGKDGPVILGASVLPVIGALVSRPDLDKSAYLNPKNANDTVIKKWMSEHWEGRRPAAVDDIPVNRTILKLKTVQDKSAEEQWKPLKAELKLRKGWIQTHNLDEKSFKQLSLAMEGSCKEP